MSLSPPSLSTISLKEHHHQCVSYSCQHITIKFPSTVEKRDSSSQLPSCPHLKEGCKDCPESYSAVFVAISGVIAELFKGFLSSTLKSANLLLLQALKSSAILQPSFAMLSWETACLRPIAVSLPFNSICSVSISASCPVSFWRDSN